MGRGGRARIAAVSAALSLAACLAGCGGDASSRESMIKDDLAILNEEADILEKIRDQATAETALPKLQKRVDRALTIKVEMEKMPKASREVMKELDDRYEGERMSAMQRLQTQAVRIQREVGGVAWGKINDTMSKTDGR